MDFKFDIRIIVVSLLIHVGAFALLSLYAQKTSAPNEAIEVVFNDNDNERIFLPSKPQPKDSQKEDKKTSKFFSEEQRNFEKETVAQDYGKLQNKKLAPKSAAEVDKTDTSPGPNFMPVQNQKDSQDERQSTVNFQVPNLAKGDFTFLNSDFSTYASFYNRITPKIVYNWGNNIDDIALFPHMREKLRKKLRWTTRVEMVLNRKGHFQNIIIINSSGSDELDQAVVDSLRDAAPYLNPPTGMVEKDGTVHVMGEFTIYTQRPHYANPQ